MTVRRLRSYLTPGFPPSLFEAVGAVIGAEVAFEETGSGPAPGVDPFGDGTADLGWLCATSYADLVGRSPEPSMRLVGVAWVPDDPDADGRPVYFGDVVAGPDEGAQSLDDLAGARIGGNDPVSLSGHLCLRIALAERGLDPDTFGEIVLTGGHHRSLDQVVAGELDAAVIDSAVRLARARSDPAVARLRVVERLGPWPTQPLVARAGLAERSVVDVRRRLLAAAVSGGPLQRELRAAGLAGLAEVGPADYEGVVARASAGGRRHPRGSVG